MNKKVIAKLEPQRKKLSKIEREQYLIGHIPYRLQLLRFCHSVCEQNMIPHPDHDSELRIGWAAVIGDSNDLFINPIVESGLLYCRALLEFLGVAQDRKTGQLKEVAEPKDSGDIFIKDFGLPPLTKAQTVNGFSYASPVEIDSALRSVIETANKSVAHLTQAPKLAATFPSLSLACRVVVELINRHLYAPLGEHSLVPPIDRSLTGASQGCLPAE